VAGLRWILLGAGIALILGLWWWETRRPKRSPPHHAVDRWPENEDAAPDAPGEASGTAEFIAEVPYTPTIERVRVARRPPLIEIPEDMEVDVSDFVGFDRRHSVEGEFAMDDASPPDDPLEGAVIEAEPEPAEDDEPDEHHRAPWVRTQPLERDEVAPKREEELPEPPPADPVERRAAEAARQRIVALRLVAPGERWPGTELRAALLAEGLSFGPYSIFHREREDGKSLFYVASMMEPGSFDIERMDEQDFPGISLFGIVPGPLDAPSTFDLVLAAGRSLAERMKGQLQDEQGSTLTAQRILNLREDLVHFEHRNRRLRRN
jgi:cell division protein ZipA